MRIFSKLVFICNICFLISVWMRFSEISSHSKGNTEHIIKLQPVENTLILLGYGAIFINAVFVVIVFFRMIQRRTVLPLWITVFNCVLFIFQLYYFFIYK